MIHELRAKKDWNGLYNERKRIESLVEIYKQRPSLKTRPLCHPISQKELDEIYEVMEETSRIVMHESFKSRCMEMKDYDENEVGIGWNVGGYFLIVV